MSTNVYEKYRTTMVPERERKRAQARFRAIWSAPPMKPGDPIAHFDIQNALGPPIRVLVGLERDEDGQLDEHVSLSLSGLPHVLPSWEAVVLVRSLAWDDDVEVHQVLPSITGSKADRWVNLAEVLHLHRRRPEVHGLDPTSECRLSSLEGGDGLSHALKAKRFREEAQRLQAQALVLEEAAWDLEATADRIATEKTEPPKENP